MGPLLSTLYLEAYETAVSTVNGHHSFIAIDKG